LSVALAFEKKFKIQRRWTRQDDFDTSQHKMPASQLKRLKTSLREQGVTGPQKSKKQKKELKGRSGQERVDRNVAMQQIRDSFNPFEMRQASRPAKFQSASLQQGKTGRYKDILHRPGVSKSAGEQMRRATLLPEMHSRNKTGGLVDRRIGEGDVDMTPEERAMERYALEKQRKKGGSMFDLEGSDDDGGFGLTHGGKKIQDLATDDFKDDVSGGSDDDSDGELMRKKRRRSDVDDEGEGNELTEQPQEPERKKTKNEVMQEVIAKSKQYKYERQKVAEEDEDLREKIDKEMSDMLALLSGHKPPTKAQLLQKAEAKAGAAGINPDRQLLIDSMDRVQADKEYDVRMRQYAQDTRAKPSDRTKTEEEKAAAEAERLRKLEEKRAKRMNGEDVSDDEPEEEPKPVVQKAFDAQRPCQFVDEDEMPDEGAEFGFTSSLAQQKPAKEEKAVQPDEDDFALDDDLIASGSDMDADLSDMSEGEESGSGSESESDDDNEQEPAEGEEDEFVREVLGDSNGNAEPGNTGANTVALGVRYTYPCPRSHAELLEVIKDIEVKEIPTIVQRIRALHHPSLSSSNKEAMAEFSTSLVDHIAYMGNNDQSLATTEQLIRHLHSLSRTYPTEIATAFRTHLQAFQERGQPTAGDLVILTAIGSVYPPSDHFHQVVTPAITLMARWLGIANPTTSAQHTQGAYLVRLILSYQKLSKRYVPEAIRFSVRALAAKQAPNASQKKAHLENISAMANLWKDKTAFVEIFRPLLPELKKAAAKKDLQNLEILLSQARLRRRPLTLHNHKPLSIRQSIPKFEETFDPTKHYDPDKERSDAAKLQKEYKRERKGAVRELRKDANFIAREQLREKREKDAAYEKKQKRLIAEIQGEEGREAKEYQREKMKRKGQR
jgi:nucleolar protein 14